MAGDNILLLRLEGALQSWGREAYWNGRSTDLLPRKSAVMGLIACAMGIPREDPRLAELNQEVIMGIRVDAPGVRMTDFQTVTGHPLMTAEGRPRPSNTFLSRREYLQDASFLIALEGEDSTLQQIAEALQDPVWPVYLGRKSCVPTRPVFEALTDEYSDVHDALMRHDLPPGTESVVVETETQPPFGDAAVIRRDDVSNGTTGRNYSQRKVWRSNMEVHYVPDAH